MKNFNSEAVNNGCTRTRVYGPTSKHAVNLQRNKTLHFQVGLILALFASLFFVELRTPEQAMIEKPIIEEPFDDLVPITAFTIEKPVVPQMNKKILSSKALPLEVVPEIIDIPIEKLLKNKSIKSETVVSTTDEGTAISVGSVDYYVEPEVVETFATVEFAPIFPGCEKLDSNTDRIACFNSKVQRLVQRNFNIDIAQDLGITGKQRIYAQFEVTKSGVVDLKDIRAPHPALAQEAKRVIQKMPMITPGKMGARSVGVLYTLPITFNVVD